MKKAMIFKLSLFFFIVSAMCVPHSDAQDSPQWGLPKSLKQRIHKVIREQTRTSSVIIGTLVIGFAISALELVCTGQVYLPTITFVMGVEGMRANALAYLILYNMMFITPLLIVFGFVYWGTTSIQLGGVLQRHLMSVKLGTGLLLLGLGFWLLLRTV